MGKTTYDSDVLQWSIEQAAALRAGDFAALDIEHLADEIEDVGRSEKRELASRMAVLLAHLLKWEFQPERRRDSDRSWRTTIRVQREQIQIALAETPSLKTAMRDQRWQRGAWIDACSQAEKETGLAIDTFLEACPWTVDQVLEPDWFPA